MTTSKLCGSLVGLALGLGILVGASPAMALGEFTTLSYRGYLEYNGVAVSGDVRLKFELVTVNAAGTGIVVPSTCNLALPDTNCTVETNRPTLVETATGWDEEHTVTLTAGSYQVALGSIKSLVTPTNYLGSSGENVVRCMRISVVSSGGAVTPLKGRHCLLGVPYSIISR